MNIFKRKAEQSPLSARYSREYTYLTTRLADIRTNFDSVTDSDLTDALIFEENAVLSRLNALYKRARGDGVRLEIYELKK